MKPDHPSVYTIEPSNNFLETLARSILNGKILSGITNEIGLSDLTLLLPTRRATRAFAGEFGKASNKQAAVLPKIFPIGDVVEPDDIHREVNQRDTSEISRFGQLLIFQKLVQSWAERNIAIELAAEVVNNPQKCLNLAESLLEFVEQIETLEADIKSLPELYELELAEHRGTLLSLIEIVDEGFAAELSSIGKTTLAKRRNAILRKLATELSSDARQNPIIAAGSTGTIPATRAFLKSIAYHSCGAIVLPGLDLNLDSKSWRLLPAEHPQYSMKILLDEIGIDRADVKILGTTNPAKSYLISELMRPSSTIESWHETLPGKKLAIQHGAHGIAMIEAKDRHQEARQISLAMRDCLRNPSTTIALVTPDRDLARRVKNELSRWKIEVSDSAGDPMSRSPLGGLVMRLIKVLQNEFLMVDLLDLLYHPYVSIADNRVRHLDILRNFERIVLRSVGVCDGRAGFHTALNRARQESVLEGQNNGSEISWETFNSFVEAIQDSFVLFDHRRRNPTESWIQLVLDVVKTLTPGFDWTSNEAAVFESFFSDLQGAHVLNPQRGLDFALVNLSYALQNTIVRQPEAPEARLAIYGTLEARLIAPDVLILGGLNESKWPSVPETGAWLNRAMREKLKLEQPERSIGLAAHDFTQGLGHPNLMLTWTQRISGAPLTPSRWILRLRSLFQAAGLDESYCIDDSWKNLSQSFESSELSPIGRPFPKPPIAARPARFSVTEIERLLADPYAIYAKKILGLSPLEKLSRKADARLRGILFHAAIAMWNKTQLHLSSEEGLASLINCGRVIFDPLKTDPVVSAIWWPAFQRIAARLVKLEEQLQKDSIEVHAEARGKVDFIAGRVLHFLVARADRIDVLNDMSYRIIDYKSGVVPSMKNVASGQNPQLTLQAEMLALGKFEKLPPGSIDALCYVKLSSGRIALETTYLKPKDMTIADLAREQFDNLKSHLELYQDFDVGYLSRRHVTDEREDMEYDHLSRFSEWVLAKQ